MKTGLLTILLLCLAITTSAQTASTEPPLSIVKHNWSKERINWEADPFGGPVESFDDVRRRRADERRIERARGTGNIGEASKVEREMRAEQVIKARPPAPPRYAFRYRVLIKNTSDKTIKSIDWDYVSFSSNTQSEAGRVEFSSDQKIAPGAHKELNVMAYRAPAKTISVYSLDKQERQGLDGRVVVMRIVYTDGSIWQRP